LRRTVSTALHSIYEHDASGATAQRLDAHTPGAGKEIQQNGISYIPAQDIKEGFLDAIGDRTSRISGHGQQLASLGRSGNYTHTNTFLCFSSRFTPV